MVVESAVGELATEYEGRVEFEIVPAEETNQRHDEIVAFGFEAERHGLVGFDREGEAQVTMPGHNFGKDEIAAAIESLLSAE